MPITKTSENLGWNLVKELEMGWGGGWIGGGLDCGKLRVVSCRNLVFSAEGSTNAKMNEMAVYVQWQGIDK